MSDEPCLLAGREQLHVVQREPDGGAVGGLEHGAGLVRGSLPGHPGPVEVPRPVQPQVAVQAAAVVEPGEQVLADGRDVEHGASGEVVLHEPWVPQLASHE
jgi:hypothetical protein